MNRPFPKEVLELLPPDIREVFEELNVQMWTPGDKVSGVMCCRVTDPEKDKEWVVPGSRQVACFKCHHRIYISPGTWQEWSKNMPGTPLLCTECMMEQIPAEEPKP